MSSMSKETDIAYLAGIVDGEGSITLNSNTSRSVNAFRAPCVTVTNTDRGLLEFLQEELGGSIRVQKKYKEHHKQAWVWSVRFDAALRAIEVLRPYLRHSSKVQRADFLLNGYKAVTQRNGKYTPAQAKLKQEFEEQLLAL
jgi:hypothetical protein